MKTTRKIEQYIPAVPARYISQEITICTCDKCNKERPVLITCLDCCKEVCVLCSYANSPDAQLQFCKECADKKSWLEKFAVYKLTNTTQYKVAQLLEAANLQYEYRFFTKHFIIQINGKEIRLHSDYIQFPQLTMLDFLSIFQPIVQPSPPLSHHT